MLTARGLALLVGAALAVAVGRLLGVTELLLVATAAVALVALAAVSVRFSAATVSVARETLPPRLAFGETGQVRLEVRNRSRVPAALLLVEDRCPPALAAPPRFVVPALAKGASRAMRYRIRGRARGRHLLGPVNVRVQDPFGLAERVRRTSAIGEVLVHPHVEALGDGHPRGAQSGDGRSRARRLFAAGSEFHSMREYVRGDDLRSVHWPSTARRQTLMVRQHEQSDQPHATVLCDTREIAHLGKGESSTLEKVVSISASVLVALIEHGYATQWITDAMQTAPATRGGRHQRGAVEHMLDRLAELPASDVQTIGPALERAGGRGPRGLLIAVLGPPSGADDPRDVADLRALRIAGRRYHERIAIVVVDPGRRLSAANGEAAAATLAAAGWKAATARVGEPFAPVWRQLLNGQRPAVAAPKRAKETLP